MKEENSSSYYAVIPAYIRYNKHLKYAERLFYGEITALSNNKGYCYAKNKYFADLYEVSQSTISRWISHLAELKAIRVEIIRDERKEIKERRIYINDTPYMQNCIYPYVQKSQDPICKKRKENNINNNMLDSLYNYIINKEKKISKEFEECESEVLEVLNKYELVYSEQALAYMREENIEKIKLVSYCLALLVRDKVSHLLYKMNREQLFSLLEECKIREIDNKDTDNRIKNFYNYYYKSLKAQLLKGSSPSFFMSKNVKEENKTSEEDEEGEEICE